MKKERNKYYNSLKGLEKYNMYMHHPFSLDIHTYIHVPYLIKGPYGTLSC